MGEQVKAGDHYMTLDLNPSNNNCQKNQKPCLHLTIHTGTVSKVTAGVKPIITNKPFIHQSISPK